MLANQLYFEKVGPKLQREPELKVRFYKILYYIAVFRAPLKKGTVVEWQFFHENYFKEFSFPCLEFFPVKLNYLFSKIFNL